jgi:hypothetical protein
MSRRARSKARMFAIVLALAAVPAAVAVVSPAIASADSCSDAATNAPLPLELGACADVLAQEARWLKAITAGDVPTVESILSPTYKHINSDGQLLSRADEIASTEPLPITMNPSEQLVDIAGDTAVIHGVNTMTQDGKVVGVSRFTDVFVLQNGVWLALSAQETAT